MIFCNCFHLKCFKFSSKTCQKFSVKKIMDVDETVLQAYTSQFVALVMFGLVMCEDRISMQSRRREIIQGMRKLPGMYHQVFLLFTVLFAF